MANPATIAARRELLVTHQQRCASCKIIKDLAEFSTSPSTTTGRHAYCRVCDAAKQRARRARRREIRARVLAEYRTARPHHPVIVLECCGAEFLGDAAGSGAWVHDPACPARHALARSPHQASAARNGLTLWPSRGPRS